MITAVGIAVRVTVRECSSIVRSPPTVETARFAVSEIRATLLPRMAPDTAAAAVIGWDTSAIEASATKAMPTAPTVVSALPSTIVSADAMTNTVTKKNWGLMIAAP